MAVTIHCECDIGFDGSINSAKAFEEYKAFFETHVQAGEFVPVKVEKPYFTGYGALNKKMDWYADKWYICKKCNTLWEFTYPDFPAKGFVRCLPANRYTPREEYGLE